VGMLHDAVRLIGGARVDATALMGPGVDPHLYRATAGDVQTLERADVVFYVGLELEGRMGEIFEKMTTKGRRVVAAGDAAPRELLRTPSEFEGRYDPHLWFDPTIWTHVVDAVERTLSELDPGSAELYRANAQEYRRELVALHEYARDRIAEIPEEARVLVTAHDAFGYFGERYGMEVLGIQGASTATEASAGDIRQMASAIAERRIKAIFVESSVPPSTIEALRRAVQSRGWDVRIGGELFSDAMGAEGTAEGTYAGMFRHNVDTIVEALK
jgi:manganese/zinc/iron transport system substrate-binding protein